MKQHCNVRHTRIYCRILTRCMRETKGKCCPILAVLIYTQKMQALIEPFKFLTVFLTVNWKLHACICCTM
jgi:hypothetical protein